MAVQQLDQSFGSANHGSGIASQLDRILSRCKMVVASPASDGRKGGPLLQISKIDAA